MKLIKYLIFFLVVGAAVAAPAEDYTRFEWIAVTNTIDGPVTTHDAVQGYKIYCNPAILDPAQLKTFNNQIDVPGGQTEVFMLADITTLQEGPNWCAMTAYNFDNAGAEQEGSISNWIAVKMTAGRFQNGSVPAVVNGFKLK